MTRAQSTVIWLGLVLVAFNLIIHAGVIKSVIFGNGTQVKSPASPTANNPANVPAPVPNPSATPPAVQVQVM